MGFPLYSLFDIYVVVLRERVQKYNYALNVFSNDLLYIM